MKKAIKTEVWIPAGGMDLEENALKVVKNDGNKLVVAGPGAGKTELLAQKVCYLLQTNTCRFPHRILAISFKRDAAFNLKERVKLRCGEELSRRFDSLTFDSFAKQILDRFGPALPEGYKVSSDYDIVLADRSVLDFYEAYDFDFFNSTNHDALLKAHTHHRLPLTNDTNPKLIRAEVWRNMLRSTPSQISFKMVMRLAELIMGTNEKLREYLQDTYSYVFLDEFQDATNIQYEFFKTCFVGSGSQFTAVGDDKQRIMLWAGAQPSVFEDFLRDTDAERVPLKMNFRCAPRLVQLLNHLSKHLLNKEDVAEASPKWKGDEGKCDVWIFDNPDPEMKILLGEVKQWTTAHGLKPRDICILVKNRLDAYAGALIDYFNAKGIKARDENKYQDLLTQELVQYIVNTLSFVFDKTASASKAAAFSFLSVVNMEMEDTKLLKLETSFARFIDRLRKDYSEKGLTAEQIGKLVDEIVDFADERRIRTVYLQYKNPKELKRYIDDTKEEITANYEELGSLISALDKLMGTDTIPVMTIHKSKGLEYHTVIFIGLEDGAFWSFQRQPDEDKCAFFVALSRAKERVVFTFSKKREGRNGMQSQSFHNISVLFEELEKSGIVTIEEKACE